MISFDKNELLKMELPILVEKYKSWGPLVQQQAKSFLEKKYHEQIRIHPSLARQIEKKHKELVAIQSKNEEIFSFMLGVQQPHATNQKWEIHKGVPSQLAAHQILMEMGSDIIKLAPENRHLKKQGFETANLNTLTDRLKHPLYKQILDMPYRVAFFWAHGSDITFDKKMSFDQKRKLYDEFYELTQYLLKTYNRSGKVFMVGNWEGDWLLTSQEGDLNQDADSVRIENMIDWFNIRSKAIEQAKIETHYEDVRVHLYCELNHVSLVANKGYKRIVNSVLPYTYVDYVSISSYDMQGIGNWKSDPTESALREFALPMFDFVEEHLPPRDIPGKRVFTGEVGFTIHHINHLFDLHGLKAEREQARLSLINAKVNLEWGMPFWIVWALHNNELQKNGEFRGWGIYDQVHDRKRVLFQEMVSFYKWAKDFKAGFEKKNKKSLTPNLFREHAVQQLDLQISKYQIENK